MSSDNSIALALQKRKEQQDIIRKALAEIAEIEGYLQFHRKLTLGDTAAGDQDKVDTLGHGGSRMAQEIFESLVVEVLRDVGRPLQSGEVVEEFRARGHPIGGKNEIKTAWNRLWEAGVRGPLVNLQSLGYWLANEPIPENVEIPEKRRKRIPAAPRPKPDPKRRGRPPILNDKQVEQVKEMARSGSTALEIANALGGVSRAIIYRYIKEASETENTPQENGGNKD